MLLWKHNLVLLSTVFLLFHQFCLKVPVKFSVSCTPQDKHPKGHQPHTSTSNVVRGFLIHTPYTAAGEFLCRGNGWITGFVYVPSTVYIIQNLSPRMGNVPPVLEMRERELRNSHVISDLRKVCQLFSSETTPFPLATIYYSNQLLSEIKWFYFMIIISIL